MEQVSLGMLILYQLLRRTRGQEFESICQVKANRKGSDLFILQINQEVLLIKVVAV